MMDKIGEEYWKCITITITSNGRKIWGDWGVIDKFKFEPYINEIDTVIDFGWGRGYILSNQNYKREIGIEINSTAREYDREKNEIEMFSDADSVPDRIADVIISHHALEHTKAPYEIIVKLSSKLKNTGKIVFVVPSEKKTKYNPEDINIHLYTWSEKI